MQFSFQGVLVRAGVCPFAQGGLDESFGLAVSLGPIGAGEAMFDVLAVKQLAELPVPAAGAVVGQHAPDREPEAGKMGARHQKEAHG